jgi:alginate O-acetyltransferase complex protein AlgJ
MKKFVFKLSLFLGPFLVALALELFVLPIDFFTFRVHEALVVRKFRNILEGNFYPNRNLIKEEEGDLGHHTKYTFKRTVQWITDSHGYRKKESGRLEYDVVIIGQSETFGASLTQKEMLSEMLEEQLHLGVYPFAPAGVSSFLKERRFILYPPKIVIVTSMERAIFLLPPARIRSGENWGFLASVEDRIETMRENRWVQSIGVFLDRLYKMNMVRYLKASLERKFSGGGRFGSTWVDTRYGTIFFLEGAKANREVPEKEMDRAVRTIKGYEDVFKSRGIRFIFLPIPNKETIFYEALGTRRPVFLKRLVRRLRELGVETVDAQQAFEKAFQEDSVLLYQRDDSHWNANGVRIAADLLRQLIEKGRSTSPLRAGGRAD